MIRNWELQVQFKVHGKGKELFGDGFAIWYTKDRARDGPVFGSSDLFHGMAIILDTYSNHNGPHNVRTMPLMQKPSKGVFCSINIPTFLPWLTMEPCRMITIGMELTLN